MCIRDRPGVEPRAQKNECPRGRGLGEDVLDLLEGEIGGRRQVEGIDGPRLGRALQVGHVVAGSELAGD
eukprot:2729612-Alexandrium_andersonii.AAC.1